MNKGRAIREMFDRIAPRYDLVNSVMTAGIDASWRRRAVASLDIRAADSCVIDLCCGTGALTREIAGEVPAGKAIGVDFSPVMLDIARARSRAANIEYHECDVLHLPFANGIFDGATMGFSMRNVVDIEACLRETARTLKPGARFVNLEVSRPRNALWRGAFLAYFNAAVPLIGRFLGGDPQAYRYLPQSLVNFPDSAGLSELFLRNGFERVRGIALMGGVAALHIGVRKSGVGIRDDEPRHELGSGGEQMHRDYASSA